jgi:hypothetical protein
LRHTRSSQLNSGLSINTHSTAAAQSSVTISRLSLPLRHSRADQRQALLRVSQDDDDGVIRVDDDPIRRTAPLGVLSGAVVGVVTALPSG